MRDEIEVQLPSGGRAWIAAVIDHEQANILRRHSMRIARYLDEHDQWRRDLTDEQLDALDELRLQSPSLHIRTIAIRWEDVTDSTGAAIEFPADVDQMQQPDYAALFEAVTTLRQKDAEGNWIPRSAPL